MQDFFHQPYDYWFIIPVALHVPTPCLHLRSDHICTALRTPCLSGNGRLASKASKIWSDEATWRFSWEIGATKKSKHRSFMVIQNSCMKRMIQVCRVWLKLEFCDFKSPQKTLYTQPSPISWIGCSVTIHHSNYWNLALPHFQWQKCGKTMAFDIQPVLASLDVHHPIPQQAVEIPIPSRFAWIALI